MKAEHFFTEGENKKITAAIRDVESRTDGEIAVMVVDSSNHYREAEVLAGIVLGSLLALIVTVLFFHDSLWVYISFSILLFFPFSWICARVPQLKAAFLSVKKKEEMVRLRALRAFYEKGLYRTQHHTGVLFFISLMERKVWVLADKGIYKKMDQETLNQFAGMVSHGIKEGRACEASLCQAVEGVGRLLTEHFPHTPGHVDQLPDQVLTE